MARLRSATVTVLVSVVMRGLLLLLRLAGPLRLLGSEAQDRVGLAAEGAKVDLHAVEHCAPVPHDRRHGDRLANFLIRRAIRLGGGSVEIDAVLAGNLRGD